MQNPSVSFPSFAEMAAPYVPKPAEVAEWADAPARRAGGRKTIGIQVTLPHEFSRPGSVTATPERAKTASSVNIVES